MGVLETFRAKRATQLYECRDCGTKVEKPVDECPVCASGEIAHYEF